MIKVTENYITDIEPQSDFEKSYNVTIYENVEKQEDGTYKSTRIDMNNIEYREYQQNKINILQAENSNLKENLNNANSTILDMTEKLEMFDITIDTLMTNILPAITGEE